MQLQYKRVLRILNSNFYIDKELKELVYLLVCNILSRYKIEYTVCYVCGGGGACSVYLPSADMSREGMLQCSV